MRHNRQRLAQSGRDLCAMLVMACAPAGTAPVPADPPLLAEPAIATDSAAYTLRGATSYSVRLEMTFSNRTGAPVELSPCSGNVPERLDRWSGSRWESGLRTVNVGCVHRVSVAPGATYRHSDELLGARPSTRFEPAWSQEEPWGVYRIVWLVYRAGEPSLIPLEHRSSNPITLRRP